MIKLYYDLMSQPSRACYIFLKKFGLPFEKKLVDLKSGQHKSPEYLAIHPFGQVPAIDHDGFKLFESVGILRYLCREFPNQIPEHWYPSDSKKQARVDEYLEWQHANTRMHMSMYFQHKVLIPALTGKTRQSSIDRFKAGSERVLGELETYWLKDKPYLGGEKISIADLLAVCEIKQLDMTGYTETFDGRPKVADWFQRVTTELNPAFDEGHAIVNKIAAKARAKL